MKHILILKKFLIMTIVSLKNKIIFFIIAFLLIACNNDHSYLSKNIITEKKIIDSTLISFDSTDRLKLNLYVDTVSDTSNYIYLQTLYYSSKSASFLFKLPSSNSGYGYGSGFSSIFDEDNIISTKIQRTKHDFIIVQHQKRESLYYYFEMNVHKEIILKSLFIIFRYSNNYGVEPEKIELSVYNINKNIMDIDATCFNTLEKKVIERKPDKVHNYEMLPHNEELITLP